MIFNSKDLLKSLLRGVEKQYESRKEFSGFESGFPELDKSLGGLAPGELLVVAGKPSSGKTAFIASIIAHLTSLSLQSKSNDASPHILVFDLETSSYQFIFRLLASCAKLSIESIRASRTREKDWPPLLRAAQRIAESKLSFVDRRHLTIPQLFKLVLQHWDYHGLNHLPCSLTGTEKTYDETDESLEQNIRLENQAIILIDGLQELASGSEYRTRDEEISRVITGLKTLAREFGCPVVATSRLNRRWDSRDNPAPKLQDLRDSGSIEDVADAVLFLDSVTTPDPVTNPEFRDLSATDVVINVMIAKNRYGSRKSSHVILDAQIGQFRSTILPKFDLTYQPDF